MLPEVLISISIFSVIPVIVRLISANPLTIGLFRLVVAACLLTIYWNKKIEWRAFNKKGFWKLALIGLCFFMHWMTYTYSIKIAGPSICVLGMATYGVQLIFYGAIFLNYHINKKNILCLILILSGVILVVPNLDIHDDTTFGLILGLLSAAFYSFIPILLQKSQEFKQETRIFFQFSIALIGYLALFKYTQWTDLRPKDWYGLIFLGVAGTFIAHTLWSKVSAKLPTTTTGIIYYLITPMAMALSYLILGENLTLKQQLGGVIILVAALINTVKLEKFTKFRKYLGF